MKIKLFTLGLSLLMATAAQYLFDCFNHRGSEVGC